MVHSCFTASFPLLESCSLLYTTHLPSGQSFSLFFHAFPPEVFHHPHLKTTISMFFQCEWSDFLLFEKKTPLYSHFMVSPCTKKRCIHPVPTKSALPSARR